MTMEEAKEEAIAQLERISKNLASIGETVDYTGFAIKALQQEPVYFPPCVDCNTKMNEIREAYDNLKKQEPSEWQQDHAILKAHADGANEVVDRIKEFRGDVSVLREERRTIECHCGCASDVADEVLELIDKLIAEVEGTNETD